MYFRLLIGLFITKGCFSQALFFSEYVEGSGTNNYLELFNNGNATVSLANYQIHFFTNGTNTASTKVTLSGNLAAHSTVVYKNSSATLYSGTATAISGMTFNGDDAILLYQISSNTYIDGIGVRGCDPGTEWKSLNHSTLQSTLRRKGFVCNGALSTTDCVFDYLESEWQSFAFNDVSDLGKHIGPCSSCIPDNVPHFQVGKIGTTAACTQFDVHVTLNSTYSYIVFLSDQPISALPKNRYNYYFDTTFAKGSQLASGVFCVYKGTAEKFTVYNVLPNTSYYGIVMTFSTSAENCTESYRTSDCKKFNVKTLGNCGGLQIRTLFVDPCTLPEGYEELMFAENQEDSISINSLELKLPNSYTFCNPTCGARSIVRNDSLVQALNDSARCNLFHSDSIIPPYAKVILFFGFVPNTAYNFSSLCGDGNYYSVLCLNNKTLGSGFLSNFGNGLRTIYLNSSEGRDEVTYNPSECTGDGTYVDFSQAGTPTYRNTLDCIIPLTEIDVSWDVIQENNKWIHTICNNETRQIKLKLKTVDSEFDAILFDVESNDCIQLETEVQQKSNCFELFSTEIGEMNEKCFEENFSQEQISWSIASDKIAIKWGDLNVNILEFWSALGEKLEELEVGELNQLLLNKSDFPTGLILVRAIGKSDQFQSVMIPNLR